jgi:hypothetical protein
MQEKGGLKCQIPDSHTYSYLLYNKTLQITRDSKKKVRKTGVFPKDFSPDPADDSQRNQSVPAAETTRKKAARHDLSRRPSPDGCPV